MCIKDHSVKGGKKADWTEVKDSPPPSTWVSAEGEERKGNLDFIASRLRSEKSNWVHTVMTRHRPRLLEKGKLIIFHACPICRRGGRTTRSFKFIFPPSS